MAKDLVSIIIPVFNNVNLLRDSLSSVINQTYDNIEIIIIDDGSNEYKKILIICKQFKKKIKIIRFKNNKGVSSALNKGISISKGKYINWLSHDDLFFPTKIEEQIKSLKGSVNKISVTNFIIWDYEKNFYTNSRQQKKDFVNFKDKILINDIYNFCTFLIPKVLFSKNLFNQELKYTQDYDMMLKLSKKANFSFLNKNLFISRKHLQQGSVNKKNEWDVEKNKFYVSHANSYIQLLKNKKSILDIFFILIFIHLKKLNDLNQILEKKINNQKIVYINFIVKLLFKILNAFKII
jgi:glycosyltransferase involved in cell wall biosynthesis